ncbi:hypothetical protein AQI95_05020 [Streptomyces yokosukanensis]|uniref:Uncharacterized protein n=1 Tax=Streptomyces yokosukanensis TaxID=67386 RepID=A0A101PCX8_9ACTN|nr:hypothetical protein [Streptomyces yokosukanensis]KUN09211.1 hypothetical protein AQI95_05020 [Streptomyces yokosukanensis]
MSEIVVYEVDKPSATRSAGPSAGAERRVRRVHASPAVPGSRAAAGPRTLCGKDTFAMETAHWTPPDRPGTPWYPEEYATLVCPDCAAVMEI